MSSEENEFDGQLSEPIEIPIEDALDLHAFAPKDVVPLVQEYLVECQRRGIREVRIIHGRGKGIQREAVRSWLRVDPLVVAFRDAPPEAGGWGATIVHLKDSDPDQQRS
jgi:DNA-nicking Smr family endonuclease